MLRFVRLTAGAVVLATAAMSGLAIGPAPPPARAGLASVGINDSLTMTHDRTAVVAAPGVLANDLNLLGGTTAILVSGVTHGALSLQSNGGYTYSPAAAYVGGDSFTYRPSGVLSTPATVTITITNATPVARPDAYSGSTGATLVVAAPGVLANDTDADGDGLTTDLVGGISGSLTLDPDGGFRYTPGGGFSGTATFSYRVWDGVAWSGTTSASLTVAAPTPTPTPTPSSTATPSPTPMPSLPIPPLPLPTPVLPLPSISPPHSRSPTPTDPAQSQSSPATSSQGPSGTASPSVAQPGAVDPPSAPAAGGRAVPGPGLHLGAQGLDLGVGTIGLLAGLEIWAVPAAMIGGPGLLVLLWIALQAAGATAWIPAARRLRDGDASRARRWRGGVR